MTELEALRKDGVVVAEDLLDEAELDAVRAELEPHFGREGFGRNDFEGLRTERVYSVLAKCPSVARLVEHPRILALLDEFLRPSRLLAACQATRIHPGETAQNLHADDELGAPPRPRAPNCVSVMWTLSEYTPENGSTLIVPGSHLWDHERRPEASAATAFHLRSGSALIWLGGVYHGGGANTSDVLRTGVSIIYFQPWLRQIENMTLAVPPQVAAQYSERVQRMLGYDVIDGNFYGHVNGRNPIKLITRREGTTGGVDRS
jgi:ectoine hydroxylase-related dioxygenase (phytanoyl-CoA dioxygenase family)